MDPTATPAPLAPAPLVAAATTPASTAVAPAADDAESPIPPPTPGDDATPSTTDSSVSPSAASTSAPSALPRGCAFHAAHTIASALSAVTSCLKQRGMRQSTARDRQCVLQWVPYTRIKWAQVLASQMMASSYYMHSGLARKDILSAVLAGVGARDRGAALGVPSHGDSDAGDLAPSAPAAPAAAPAGAPAAAAGTDGTPASAGAGADAEAAIRWAAYDGSIAAAANIETLATNLDPRSADDVSRVARLMKHREEGEGVVKPAGAAAGAPLTETATGPRAAWVLKAGSVNNALSVRVCTASNFESYVPHMLEVDEEASGGVVGASPGLAGGKRAAPAPAWVVQRYIDRPLLVDGRKFHLRVNVLARGFCEVFVHREVIAHVACEAYVAGDWGNQWVHITNHGVQRGHPTYDPAFNTPTLDQLLVRLTATPGIADADAGSSESTTATSRAPTEAPNLFERICALVADTFAAFRDKRKYFLPLPNCFELFGFDIMLDDAWRLWLLEINDGPALEAVAMPDACARIVEDTARLVVDPWWPPGEGDDAAGAAGAVAVAGEDEDERDGNASAVAETSSSRASDSRGFRKVYQFAPNGKTGPVFATASFREHVAECQTFAREEAASEARFLAAVAASEA